MTTTTLAIPVLAISGSLRNNSSNAALLRAAADLAPGAMTFRFYDHQLGTLPAFNPDLDGEGAVPPTAVAQLRGWMGEAAAVIISTPEYAHGAPGVLKNALDWIVSSGELENKPVLLLAASPSGGKWAQSALTPTLEVMGAQVIGVPLVFTRTHLDAAGKVVNPEVLIKLQAGMTALARALAPASSGADG
jgi:chromate reductase